MDKYILDGKIPKKVLSIIEWGAHFEKSNRTVAKTTIGKIEVSTVFLGLDHNFVEGDAPLLFETITFGRDEIICKRCSTWEQALLQHEQVCAQLNGDNIVIFKAS